MHLKKVDTLKVTVIDDKTKLPVPEIVDFCVFLENMNFAQNTVVTYTKSLCKWYCFCEENDLNPLRVFSELNTPPIFIFQNFISKLFDSGLKKSTINLHLAAIYRFYNFLSAARVIGEGPIQYFPTEVKKENNTFLNGLVSTQVEKMTDFAYVNRDPSEPLEYISWEQYEILVSACNHIRDKVLLGLMFECGLRVGEVLGIHISDIQLEDNTISIKYRDNNENCAFVKRRASRKVVISNRLAKYILNLLLQIENFGSEFLFITMYSKNGINGKALTYIDAQKICEALSKKTKIKFHMHMLRHGYAQERINSGWELEEISRSLGHTSIESTKIYAGYSEEYIKEKQIEFLEGRFFENDRNYKKND